MWYFWNDGRILIIKMTNVFKFSERRTRCIGRGEGEEEVLRGPSQNVRSKKKKERGIARTIINIHLAVERWYFKTTKKVKEKKKMSLFMRVLVLPVKINNNDNNKKHASPKKSM